MFLTHSSAFYFNKKFKLVGAVEKDKSKLKLFENRYKAPGFIKIKDALKKLNPDIIVVSVNTKFHLQVIKKIFLCKFKNKIIFCEKPCGNSLSEIREIKKISKKNKNKVFVNYMRNYNNNLLNEASHYINLFLKIFGKVTKVKNEIIKSLGKKINNFTLFFNKGEIKFICLNNTSYHNSRFEIFLRSRHINYDSDQDLLNFYGIKKNKIYEKLIKL